MPERTYIGGQAVLEGVMMRAPSSFAVVVRRKDGSLQVRERAMKDGRRGAAKLPLLRGVASLVESLRLGSEALRFSAEQMEKDWAAEDAAKAGGVGLGVLGALGMTVLSLMTTSDGEAPASAGNGRKLGSLVMLLVAIGFFVALPQAAAAGVSRLFGLGLPVQSAGFQALTGAFKFAILVGYMLAIRRVPDIRRVFQYHGAEHKTITTYEARQALTVENARSKTTFHPRCGTTFLVMVVLVSILAFTAVGAFLPRIQTGSAILDNVVFFFEKLPSLPVIVAVTFEMQRFFARYCTTGPLRALLWPGFMVQKITTAEPDDAQLEVALASLRVTLFRQEQAQTYAADEDVVFPDYGALLAAERLRPA
ncbi:MAG TPA: DUF1385 domain-containing protein [Polyangiaceae bacterium]|jgi:uncharacterized protein YqhQ